MKKLLTIITVFTIMASISCKDKGSSNSSDSDSAKNVDTSRTAKLALTNDSVTLNGIPLNTARAMVRNFRNNTDSYDSTKRTSVWFSKPIIDGIDSLLKSNTKTDGVRIYFAKDTTKNKPSIVVVSTADGGFDTDRVTKIHNDFFQIKKDEAYSNNADVAGKISYGLDYSGALLYNGKAKCPSKDGCDTNKQHYITCQKAQSMVNYFGKDKINGRSEWFDKQIIHELDSALNHQAGDGIRVYFARHLEVSLQLPRDTIHRHGFILITTKTIQNIHTDYFDCFPVSQQPTTRKAHNFAAKNAKREKMPVRTNGGTDNGEQCPYNCKGTSL